MQYEFTRRTAIKVGILGALSKTAVSAQANSGEKRTSPVGISTLGFHELTNRQLAKELAHAGIRIIQLFLNQSDSRYWKYNGRSDVSDMTRERSRAIAESYRAAGLTIHSMGVYTNLIHPDAAERKANLAYFDSMMQIGSSMGVNVFITEAGHFHSNEPAPPVEYHFQEPVWKQMVATGRELAKIAEANDATVLFEPFFRGFLASAKRTRLFLEEVDSPRIRALLDPANLLEVNDLEEMFDQLGPWIDCLHAKDRKLHVDRGVAAGLGDLDYQTFVRLASERSPTAPLILEYVGSTDYQAALKHLHQAMNST